MKLGVRREMNLVIKERNVDGKSTVWVLEDQRKRKFIWKTNSPRMLEIGKSYSVRANLVVELGTGWKLTHPLFS